MVITTRQMTAEQLAVLPDKGKRFELVDGELRMMSPAGNVHGRVTAFLTATLWKHVHDHGLGAVYAAETGFLISRDPDTVRAPDVAFVSKEALGQVGDVEGYLPLGPDLVAEVVSPNDSFSDIEAKSIAWLAAGTRVVWVVDPKQRHVTVYRGRDDIQVLEADASLNEPDLLPGWGITIADLFG